MADEPEKPDEELEDEPQKKSKKGIFLLGGMLSLVAVAYFGATMGTPSIEPIPQYQGPFAVSLAVDGTSQVNLADPTKSVYFLMGLNGEYEAYEEGYLDIQLENLVIANRLVDELLTLGSAETRESLSSQNQAEAFLLKVRDAINPICFAVHLGDAAGPLDADSVSGLRTGDSHFMGTLRGRYHDHLLHVDVPNKTIRLDDGEETGFNGDEVDLMVADSEQSYIFVNVTELKPDFVGELQVGVKGRLRKVLKNDWNIQ